MRQTLPRWVKRDTATTPSPPPPPHSPPPVCNTHSQVVITFSGKRVKRRFPKYPLLSPPPHWLYDIQMLAEMTSVLQSESKSDYL
ncbi:hypothetical protein EGR_06297 [Echinococcus granulosus]|uniref:Uncharacterized protein n=1 Tax=Echinococcus granulosus TaxID=6210 RepID=W6UBW3_ECHGR|nr:hypothetical protein EGR_06297 [Echinococcus granulosus]EUB58873.1 hypothetical protein EGR_06297 [Echinococcus granulosus]